MSIEAGRLPSNLVKFYQYSKPRNQRSVRTKHVLDFEWDGLGLCGRTQRDLEISFEVFEQH
eukprot:1323655-Amorphochlora_amoeboformis.AAC.1